MCRPLVAITNIKVNASSLLGLGDRAEKNILRKMRQAQDGITMKVDVEVEWPIEVMRESAHA